MTEIEALERVFDAEIRNVLPFQSKAAIYKRLREQGLIQDMEILDDGLTIRGYSLTHAGRILYCRSC